MSSRARPAIQGVTSNLVQRVWQHREGVADGFTRRYGVKMLMWFEATGSIEAAIAREKQIKNWKREWKIALITAGEPGVAGPVGRDPVGVESVDCGSSQQ